MNTATLHIKVSPEMAEGLKQLAKSRGQPVGELVRQALSSCYQTELLGLPRSQKLAVDAFLGGYLSLGKLAEKLGMHVLELRRWLNERGLPLNTSYSESDAANA